MESYYVDDFIGFDIVRFDEEIVKSDNRAMSEVVRERYGEEAEAIIREIIQS